MKKLSIWFSTATAFLATATPALAQQVNIRQPSQIKFTNIGSLIGGAVGLIIIISLILAFIFLIIGGVTWITSGGDKTQVETARNRITNAIIGLAIVFAAWAIMKLVGIFFGIDPFNLTIPTVTD